VSGSVSVSNFPATQTVDGTVAVSGTVSVDGSGVTQPISASALPLPSGASTSALQTAGNSSLATIAGDTTSLDGKILTSAPISSNGTTTAQAVNIMGTNDGTNFRTLACGDGGVLQTEVDHSWDNTNVLINNVAIAAGAEQLSSEFDLGQGVSHEIGRIEVYVNNSAGVELEVSGGALHATGGDLYLAADGAVVSSVEEKFTFSQDDVGLSAGHRFMKFNVANKDGSTSTNVTLRVAYYK